MKKLSLILIVVGVLVITTGLWFFSSVREFKTADVLHVGVIFLIVIFAVFIGLKRLAGGKRGEPSEDELSKRIVQKTAAISYYISLYIWLFMLFLKDKARLDTEEIIVTGILGMALSFGIIWIITYLKGIKE